MFYEEMDVHAINHRAGLLNYFKKGSSYKCQNFSRYGHSHKIMQMLHDLDFSNKKRNTII